MPLTPVVMFLSLLSWSPADAKKHMKFANCFDSNKMNLT